MSKRLFNLVGGSPGTTQKTAKRPPLDASPPPQLSFDALPQEVVVNILQKVARATGEGAYAAVCKRWRTLMPLAQVHLNLVHGRVISSTSCNPEDSWAKLLRRFPNVDTLQLTSYRAFSDFLLGAIAASTPKLEVLYIEGPSKEGPFSLEFEVAEEEEWSLHGLEHFFRVQCDLRSLTLSHYPSPLKMFLPQSLTYLTRLDRLECYEFCVEESNSGPAQQLLYSPQTLKDLEVYWPEPVVLVDSITMLSCLTRLCMDNFSRLPEKLGSLSKLVHLELHGEKSALPASIMSLEQLQSLTLEFQEADAVPQDLLTLPPDLLTLPQLHRLHIETDRESPGATQPEVPPNFWEVTGKQRGESLSLVLESHDFRSPTHFLSTSPHLHSLTICSPHSSLRSIANLSNCRHLVWESVCLEFPPLGGLHLLESLTVKSCKHLCNLPGDLSALKLL